MGEIASSSRAQRALEVLLHDADDWVVLFSVAVCDLEARIRATPLVKAVRRFEGLRAQRFDPLERRAQGRAAPTPLCQGSPFKELFGLRVCAAEVARPSAADESLADAGLCFAEPPASACCGVYA